MAQSFQDRITPFSNTDYLVSKMFCTRWQLVVVITLHLVTAQTAAFSELPVNNIPLFNDAIYFENMKPVKVQISTWTLQAEYELKEFIDEIGLANRSVDKLIRACREMQTQFPDSCESMGNILDLTRELNDFQSLLVSMCDKRQKRGILRWFGLMDSDDRDEINGNFKDVNEQLATQSSNLDNFFNSTNKAIAVLSGNIFKVDPKKPGTIDYTREGQLLMMDILLNKIIRKKELFMKLLESSSTVQLTDDVISPSRLLQELVKVQKILPKGFTFPVKLTLREVIKMYPLTTVAAYIDGCKMKVNILLPLCNNIEYTTLKATSIPKIKDGILTMYPLQNDVLVYNNDQHLGVVMNYNEYKACNHLHDFALCNTHHLMKNLTTSDDCIIATFFNRTTGDSDCKITRVQLRHQLWIQLADPNRWIYALPSRTTIEINFGLGNTRNIEIGGVGMLQLTRMCHIRSMDILLQYVPQLRGTAMGGTLGFQLPPVVTRDQPLIVTASDTNQVILAGKNAEDALQDRTHYAGVYRESGSQYLPWMIIGISCGSLLAAYVAIKSMYMIREKRRRLSESQQQQML